MAHARFEIPLPESTWVGRLSRQFPAVEFRLLAGQPAGDGAIELGELRWRDHDDGREDHGSTTPVDEVVSAIEADTAVMDFELLFATTDRALAQYRTTDTVLYDLSEAAGLVPVYPVTVRSGRVINEFQVPHGRLRDVTDAFDSVGLTYNLLSVSATGGAAALLTDRQHDAVETALRLGYYDTPRRATLTDVADAMEIDKSSLSGLLHRAEERIVKSVFDVGVFPE